ncbi:hypothetical protein ASG01_02470 [Chryseobacterium sp. Leaf180]|uniref:DUF6261 family protein n=1 Tax=Chryseobacterium sp. Leaf180 TaxID=1736289 RepID=UPI0006FCBC4F|nr:DUF6261 family protein [Chryseobacterium sp. Leaf180]KQR95661.1 hypothetical protein ASG01_02470 [Chryseobacterium sp. Leaf180]
MKAKISPLNLHKVHNSEFGQLIVRFFEDFENSALSASTDPDFKKLYDVLQDQLPIYNSSLDQVRASEESQQIEALDQIRDADLQALRDALKPYRNAKTAAETNAYNVLNLLMAEYKDADEESYESQTNSVNQLVERLLSADYSAHVATLGIVKFVNHVSDSNTAFNDLFAQRSYNTSQKVVYDVKQLRKKLTSDYRNMYEYISVMANVKALPFYQEVLAVINNGRNYFANTVLSRRKKDSDDEKPQE